MLEALRAATRKLHTELEEITQSSKMKEESYSPADYRKYILANFYFHQSVEQVIFGSQHPGLQPLRLHYKCKTPFLLRDLEALRLMTSENDYKLSGHSLAHIMGYLYVAEGSMLGAAIIYKLLKENPGFRPIKAFHFLSCNEGQKRKMWTEFKNYVNNTEWEEPQKTEMINAAKEAFLLYKNIFVDIQP